MRNQGGLAILILTLLGKNATLTYAQYVITVTAYINDNPFCTSVSGVASTGKNAGGAGSASESGTSGSISGGASGGSAFGRGSGVFSVASTTGSGTSGTNGGVTGVPEPDLGSVGSNGTLSGTGSAINASLPMKPIDTSSGRFETLGYFPAPADGNLLGGPVFTSPLMTAEMCGANCQGYTYMALENGDECNCGSSVLSSTSSSSPQARKKRQSTDGNCTPCAGNSVECCGAPGGYALVYHIIPYVQSSALVTYSSTDLAGSVVEALSTGYSPTSSSSFVLYTSTGSNELVTLDSATSNAAIASTSPHAYSTSKSTHAINVVPLGVRPIAPAPTELGSGSALNTINGLIGTSTSSNAVLFPTKSGTSSGKGGSTGSSSYFSEGVTTVSTRSSTRPGTSLTTKIPGLGNISGLGNSVAASEAGTATVPNSANSGPTATVAGGGKGDTTGVVGNEGNAGTVTSNGGATSTKAGGDIVEPTVTQEPSCTKSSDYFGNNTKYMDYFGYTYDIRCNLDLQSTPTDHDAYAESFETCLEYCSLLTGCIAVNYQDPPSTANNLSNCFPKWNFAGYKASGTDGVYSGVNINGASPGSLETQNLCTTDNEQDSSYAGLTYYDDFGTAWTIGCDTTLTISNAVALSNTIADTLASCVDYCSSYESCDMVNWTGPHRNGTLHDPNCFPASSIGTAFAAGSSPGSGYATLSS